MTAAAGFPIAPVSVNAPATSLASTPARTRATPFSAGFEALIKSSQMNSVRPASTAETYLDGGQSAIAEADDPAALTTQSHARLALFPQNANQNRPSLITSSAPTPEATDKSQPQHTQNAASAAASLVPRILQPESTMPSTAVAARAAAPTAPGKQTSSERATQQKQSATTSHDSSTTSQAILIPGGALTPIPVPIPSPALNPGHTVAPQTTPVSQALDRAGNSTETAPGKTSSVFTLPVSAKSAAIEQQGETVSMTAATSAEPNSSPSAIAAPTTHSSDIDAENSTQSALQHPTSPLPSSATDPALEASAAQLDPGNVSNTLQPAIGGLQSVAGAPQLHAPTNQGPAPRESGPLQRDLSKIITPQTTAIASQSTLVRDSSGIPGLPADHAGGMAQDTQAPAVSTTARNTFAALDADPGQPAMQWVHSSPRHVEAGYQDPTLGWVSVRADSTPGGLHASVVPNSPEAAQALGSHLSGLNAYLAERHGGSITASLAAAENPSSAFGQNPGQQGQSGAQHQNESSQSVAAPAGPSQTILATNTQTVEPAAFAPAHNGLISVIA